MELSDRHEAQPRRYATNRHGAVVAGAVADDYPLRSICADCRMAIVCADGTADWCHETEVERDPAARALFAVRADRGYADGASLDEWQRLARR